MYTFSMALGIGPMTLTLRIIQWTYRMRPFTIAAPLMGGCNTS